MPIVTDTRGRKLSLESRPDRIVSLVPSVTESLAALIGTTRLVGITKFCTEPADDVPAIRKIGGTKDPDVAAIVALAPDLVVANREENRAEDVQALEAAGITVFVGYPLGVRDSLDELATLATLLRSGGTGSRLHSVREEVERQEQLNAERPRVRVFCPIWRNPFMAVGGDTYAGDVIRLVGGSNVFESHVTGGRYPQVGLQEIVAAGPELILLPDEPYHFGKRHRQELMALRSLTAVRNEQVHLVDGRWLTWYGPRAAEGLAGLEALLDGARPSWKAPPRSEKPALKKAVAKESHGKASESHKTGQKHSRRNSAATKKAPARAPKTDTPMSPGLKLRVRSQEEVIDR